MFLDGLLFRIASGWAATTSPPPTPVPSPYQVFIPVVGAPSATSPGAATTWTSFLESPWLYLVLGALVGAWLALRAFERRGKPGR